MSKTPRQIKADKFMATFIGYLNKEQFEALTTVMTDMVLSENTPNGIVFGGPDTNEPTSTNTMDYMLNYMYFNTPSNFTPFLQDTLKDTLNSIRELYNLRQLNISDKKKYKKTESNYIALIIIALIVLILGFLLFQSMNKPRFSPMTAFGNRIRRIIGGKR